jgi:hypothetical protein
MKNLIILLASLFYIQAAHAAELFGTVDAVSGEVAVLNTSGEKLRASTGQKIYEGQTIQTASNGEIHIVTVDSGLIALRPNSNMRIDSYKAKGEAADATVLTMIRGAMRSISGWVAKRNPASYRINTPTATIGIRGTDHETTVLETATEDAMPGTYNTVTEGIAVIKTQHGELEVHPGQHCFALRDGTVAPGLLAQHPEFFMRRQLKIEERIKARKEALHQHVRKIMENRADKVRDLPDDRRPEVQTNREGIKKRVQERRNREHPKP